MVEYRPFLPACARHPEECPAGDGVRSPPLGREDRVVHERAWHGCETHACLRFLDAKRELAVPSLPQHALVI